MYFDFLKHKQSTCQDYYLLSCQSQNSLKKAVTKISIITYNPSRVVCFPRKTINISKNVTIKNNLKIRCRCMKNNIRQYSFNIRLIIGENV